MLRAAFYRVTDDGMESVQVEPTRSFATVDAVFHRLAELKGVRVVRTDPKFAGNKPAKLGGCGTCGISKVRWLFINWWGTPAPVRWFKRLTFSDRPEDWKGCGCIVKLKAMYEGTINLLHQVRAA